ncbi:lantibiotic dehydratase [Fluviispira sanaruensis]|uniref:Lantibiotic biosynthesis protein n=1 Tax=Fluviispira sanaruensis TaxID=2493639 RepID=A0A4P2VS77_FLUSA|nr:lantibiotic dehydratase [Fluviispira sanaruensis]BBH52115.1 lantibiotic biosynthesis protein [Fluviispira sanaruensis]
MISSAQFFMLRTPIFPLDYFIDYLKSEEDILDFLRNKSYYNIFKEALLLSSQSLYKSLVLYENAKIQDKRKVEQLRSGILKYFSRATSRATPFGYYAAVQIGHYCDKNSTSNEHQGSFLKSIRPDMEWLQTVVRRIEENIELLPNIQLKINPVIYTHGDRVLLPYSSVEIKGNEPDSKGFFNQDVSIKNNALIDYIRNILSVEIKLEDLLIKVRNKFQLKDDFKTIKLLQDLINKNFIITELKPILGKIDVFSDLLEKLKAFPSQRQNVEYLRDLKQKICKYSQINIGEGIEDLENIIEDMQKFCRVKNPLQIDIAVNNLNPFLLENAYKNKIEDAAKLMRMLSPQQFGFEHIRDYHEEFINKYGFVNEVPIQELLDENLGLGAPADYKFPQSQRKKNQKGKKTNEKLIHFILDYILQNNCQTIESIAITDQDLKNMEFDQFDSDSLLDSFEVYAQVFRNDEKLKQKVALSGLQWTPGACTSFGRFSQIFSNNEKNEIKDFIHNIEHKSPEVIYCELIYSPQTTRGGNVALTESFWSFRIYLDTFAEQKSSLLSLEDIFVCANLKRLYFKSKKYQKEVVFLSTHMLNFQNAPNIVRFMREVSSEKNVLWNFLALGELLKTSYLPRLEYNDVIFSPRTWRLSLDSLKALKEKFDIKNEVLAVFKLWKDKWKIPSLVYFVIADNRILLDLNKDYHIQEITKKIINEEKIILQEVFGLNRVEKENQVFSEEIVFPLYSTHKSSIINEINKDFQAKKYPKIFYPGSEWFYAKLYITGFREEEFISNYILNFIDEIITEISIETWFFIRYLDPKKHIRFRILLKNKNDYALLLKKFNLYFELLSKTGILNYVCIDSYEPEIERYGGADLLPLAEKIFMHDSEIVCTLLKNKKILEDRFTQHFLCAFLSFELLDAFYLDFNEKLKFANRMANKDKYIDDFREKRKDLIQVYLNNNFHFFADPNFKILQDSIKKRSLAINKYNVILEEKCLELNFLNAKYEILGSLIHMQCNRLFGTKRDCEERANAYLLHTINSLKYSINKNKS